MRILRLTGLTLLAVAAFAAVNPGGLVRNQPLASPATTHSGIAPGSDAAPPGHAGEAAPSHDGAAEIVAAGDGAHGDGHEEGGGHASPVVPVLALLLIVILAAKLGGAFMEMLGQPSVLGELIFGVILGNLTLIGFYGIENLFNVSVFGVLPAERMIEILGEIGVMLLLFEVGLESNIKEMMSVGVSSLLVATLGVVAPFFLGWGVGAWLLPDHSIYVHVFLGATLCATSVGITARVLKDLNKINMRESKIVLGAAVIDDVMGLVVLAVVSGIIVAANQAGGSGGLSLLSVAWIVGKALLFLIGAIVLGQWLAPRIFNLASKLRGQHLLLSTSLLILFLLSWAASKMGLATIVGAFAAGLILDEVHYKELRDKEKHTIEEVLHPLVGFLVPIFFVYMGYRVSLKYFADMQILGLAAGLTVAAIIGKQVCSFGVIEKGLDKLSVGFGMIPRGEVGLIFASIGMGLVTRATHGGMEPVIDAGTYGAVVIMVIITTLITPPLLKWSLNRSRGVRGYEGASDAEMSRIADERRQKRKDYFRSRSIEDGDDDRGHRRGDRSRGGRSSGRGGGSGGGRGGGRGRASGEERSGAAGAERGDERGGSSGGGRGGGSGGGRGGGSGGGRGGGSGGGGRGGGSGGGGRGGEGGEGGRPRDLTQRPGGGEPVVAQDGGGENGVRRRPRRRRRRGGGRGRGSGGGSEGSGGGSQSGGGEGGGPKPSSLSYSEIT